MEDKMISQPRKRKNISASKMKKLEAALDKKLDEDLKRLGGYEEGEGLKVFAYNFDLKDAKCLTEVDDLIDEYYIKLNDLDKQRRGAEARFRDLVRQTELLESYVNFLKQRKKKLLSLELGV
jgi:hypothetical protein